MASLEYCFVNYFSILIKFLICYFWKKLGAFLKSYLIVIDTTIDSCGNEYSHKEYISFSR